MVFDERRERQYALIKLINEFVPLQTYIGSCSPIVHLGAFCAKSFIGFASNYRNARLPLVCASGWSVSWPPSPVRVERDSALRTSSLFLYETLRYTLYSVLLQCLVTYSDLQTDGAGTLLGVAVLVSTLLSCPPALQTTTWTIAQDAIFWIKLATGGQYRRQV